MKFSERRILQDMLPWLNRYRKKPAYTLVSNFHFKKLQVKDLPVVLKFLERDENLVSLATCFTDDNLITYLTVGITADVAWTEFCLATNIVVPVFAKQYPEISEDKVETTMEATRQHVKSKYGSEPMPFKYEPIPAFGNSGFVNKFFDGAIVFRDRP